MTDADAQTRTDEAVARIAAYLNGCNEIGMPNRIDTLGWRDYPTAQLDRSDLRTVLDALADARKYAERLEAYREITRNADCEAWKATNRRTAELEAGVAAAKRLLDLKDQVIGSLRDRVAALEVEIAQLPRCGGAPSEFVRALGFAAPCRLHAGHGGSCRHGQLREAVADVSPAE